MDSSSSSDCNPVSSSSSKSPRKELQLQGPRPAPLKVRKDSYKISKKPPIPLPPQQQQQQHLAPAAPPPRPPVIIYTVSPKVIHTNPNDFMTLVQRLTGSSSSSSTATTSSSRDDHRHNHPFGGGDYSTGAISPAARYASIERANKQYSPNERNKKMPTHHRPNGNSMDGDGDGAEQIELLMDAADNQSIERSSSSMFPGILSPGPAALPVISPGFFSPLPSDPNYSSFGSFLHDLSPVVHGNKTFTEGSFMPSPSAAASSSTFLNNYITSPSTHHSISSPSFDLFNNFFDF